MTALNKTISPGVFAPVATPFDGDEQVDCEALAFNLRRYAKTRLHGYLVLGSNGENKSLTGREMRRVIEIAVCNKRPDQLVMAGAFFESQFQALDLLKDAAAIGADYGLLQSPSYFKKLVTDELIYRFFTEIADESPIPILVYNAPRFNGIKLSFTLLERLREHPNIVGMKDSSADGIDENLELHNESFSVLAGSISTLYPAMMRGSPGGTVSLANYLPEMAFELWKLGTEKDEANGELLHLQLKALNRAITGPFAVSGIKASMDLLGYKGGNPRRPLLPLNEEQVASVRAALEEAGVLNAS
jgi:4-hydroxy-2-oxoglutarate aldolase